MSKYKMCKSEITYNEEQHSVYATKFYSMKKEIDNLEQRLDKIKDYLKQVHIETQNGILSSNNLIWTNIERLCDGKDIFEETYELLESKGDE